MSTTGTKIKELKPLGKIKSKTKSIEEISTKKYENYSFESHKTYSSLNDLHIRSLANDINIEASDKFEEESKNNYPGVIKNDKTITSNLKNSANNSKKRNSFLDSMLHNESLSNSTAKMSTKYTKKCIQIVDKNMRNKQSTKIDYIKKESNKLQDDENLNEIGQKDIKILSRTITMEKKMEKDLNVKGKNSELKIYENFYNTDQYDKNCVLELKGRRPSKQRLENGSIESSHVEKNDISYTTKLNASHSEQQNAELFLDKPFQTKVAINPLEPFFHRSFELQVSNLNMVDGKTLKVNRFSRDSGNVNTNCDIHIMNDAKKISPIGNNKTIKNFDQKIGTPASPILLSKSLQCFSNFTTSPTQLYISSKKSTPPVSTSPSASFIDKASETFSFLQNKMTDKSEANLDHSQKFILFPEYENYTNLSNQPPILLETNNNDNSKHPLSCLSLLSIKKNLQFSSQNDFFSNNFQHKNMPTDILEKLSNNKNIFTHNSSNNFTSNVENMKKNQLVCKNTLKTNTNENYLCFNNEKNYSLYNHNSLNNYEKHIVASTYASSKVTKTTTTSNNIFSTPLQCNFQNFSFQQYNYNKSNKLINENIADVTFNQNFSNVSFRHASTPNHIDQSNLPQESLQQLQLPLKISENQVQHMNNVLMGSLQKLSEKNYSKKNSLDQILNLNSIVSSFNDSQQNTWMQKLVKKQPFDQKLEIATFDIPKKSFNTTECVYVPSSEHVAEIVGRQGECLKVCVIAVV